jgi:hypothetical protein
MSTAFKEVGVSIAGTISATMRLFLVSLALHRPVKRRRWSIVYHGLRPMAASRTLDLVS